MATLSHSPTFFISLSPRNSAFHNPFLVQTHFYNQQFHQLHHQHSPRQHFAIRCSSIRKSRSGRKVTSDNDLCNELREFISSVGFEEGHVPSMKELSDHGRKDLAHIVRRRGYKLIGELLANSRETYIGESVIERNEVDREDATADSENATADSENATADSENGITGQYKNADNLDELVSLSTEALVTSSYGGSMNLEPVMNARDQSFINVESPTLTDASLQEKVANFIKNGELDNFEDDSSAEVFEGNFKLDSLVEMEPKTSEEHLEYMSSGSNDGVSVNRTIVTSEQTAPPARGDLLSTETLTSAESQKDLDDETNERENQAEIDHLKLMLHQKELELSRLKEMIEKEKLALSTLQIKAESEISKAQKLVLEKDEELQAAEESLLGLKEVQIQYLGDGDIVEVAGSFNGWHHRVKLDPQPYPSSVDPIGSRKSTIWSTVLWLYPGEYEIKFVVDGQWKTDLHRESITRGTIHNNILRVDR